MKIIDNDMENQINQHSVMTNYLFSKFQVVLGGQYAVKVQTSLAPLSRFRGSRITTTHEQQCCRFQSYAKTVPSRMKLTRELTKREPHAPWFNDELRRAKQELRSLERKAFSPNGIEVDRQIYRRKCHQYSNDLTAVKKKYHTEQLKDSSSRELFRKVEQMTRRVHQHSSE